MELSLSGDSVISRSRKVTQLPSIVETVQGMAVTDEAVWITAREAGRNVVYRERIGSDGMSRFEAVRGFDVPVWIRAVGDAAIAIGNIDPPFDTWLMASDGSTVAWLRTRFGTPADPLEGGRWVSLGAWPLDCGTVVQVLADLTSRLRRLVFHRFESDGSVSTRLGSVIDQPFGVVGSYPKDRILIALADRGKHWDLQYIDWTWSIHNQHRSGQ